jgi:hypothetical protein
MGNSWVELNHLVDLYIIVHCHLTTIRSLNTLKYPPLQLLLDHARRGTPAAVGLMSCRLHLDISITRHLSDILGRAIVEIEP